MAHWSVLAEALLRGVMVAMWVVTLLFLMLGGS